MLSQLICIWSLFFVYGIQCEDVMKRIPVRQSAHYDDHNNLEFFPAIVGGIPANQGDFPAHVSIQKNGHHICGGTLIDYDYVLTAAHCVENLKGEVEPAKLLKVIAGDLTIDHNGSPSRQTKNILYIFIHDHYDPYTAMNDVALLKTETFTKSPAINVAELSIDSPKPGQNCTLAGWGSKKEGSTKPSPMLYKANLTIHDTNRCNSSYDGLISDSMFCAKGKGQDSCQGDSGGALHCGNEGLVSGIVSFGNGCDNPDFPGVYTDISKYGNFVDECIRTAVKIPTTEGSQGSKDGDKPNAPGSATQMTFSLLLATLSALIIYSVE